MLKNKVVCLDGAIGTELQRKGMPPGINPEIWCLDNPQILRNLHSDYISAGADIIYTATFGANRLKLSQDKAKDVRKLNRQLASIARQAADSNVLVAGDIGPTGEFVEPFGRLTFAETVDIFKEQVKGLIEGEVDLLTIETMMDIQEARAALIAVKETCDKFTIVTMTYENSGRTLNGTDPITALITLQSLGADAAGCNCSAGPEQMLEYIKVMKPYAAVPLVAKPNAGLPELVKGTPKFKMAPAEFARLLKNIAKTGANIVGGCCGTNPAHIQTLKTGIKSLKPRPVQKKPLSAVSSASSYVIIENKKPALIIGESINPTNKPDLQAELRDNKTGLVKELALRQKKNGAHLLDINVGMPQINEPQAIRKVIKDLSLTTSLPLVVDSSNPAAIETALKIYPGRALINSISAETSKLKKILPIAAKYGAMFIALPVSKKGIPKNITERKQNIRKIYRAATAKGFTKNDIVVDGLVMSITADSTKIGHTLKILEWCTKTFKVNTVIGLSNISFGLPDRNLINSAFLSMAASRGLSMVIANPLQKSIVAAKLASDLLLDKDTGARKYISYCSKKALPDQKEYNSAKTPQESLFNTILYADKQQILSAVNDCLKEGLSADELIAHIMVPAINKVGELYDKREYFLPQLVASAETMKKGFNRLKPLLYKNKFKQMKKNVIILATVKGDIHDIGKNIVSLMLQNHGFEVIDLGKDVCAKSIINAVKLHSASVVGLSALMTTTMVNMQHIITLAKKEKLNCRFIVGGAVVNRKYAGSIGAEYAQDGIEAVRLLKKGRE